LANFVGIVVGFLNVSIACGASSLPPRYPLNATWFQTCGTIGKLNIDVNGLMPGKKRGGIVIV
jgi:hypothetical protein